MRRYLFIIILLAAIILPVVSVYAQSTPGTTGVTSGFKALAPIPGLTGDASGQTTSVLSSKSLAEFFNNLYIYAIGLAAAIAVIQIIRAGLEIAFFNKDSVSKLMDSKGRIAQSIYGLILIFSPVVVFSIINPSILNLELNMQPLDTANGTATGGGGGGTTEQPPLSQFECTTLRSGTYLETAKCPSKALASAYVCQNTSLTLRQNLVDLPCRNFDPNTKTCVDQVIVECLAQPPLKLIYYYTEDIGYIYNSQNAPAKIIPRDTAKENAFIAGCAADGGQFQKLRSSEVTCPSDANIPPYNPLEVSGVVCQTFELNCRATGLY